jgi:hypothetical protein
MPMLDKKLREIIRCVDVLGEDAGEGNYFLDDLTLKDVSVSPRIGIKLWESLPIFGTPAEILKIHRIAKDKPEIMFSERDDSDPRLQQRTDQAAGTCQCRACQKKKAEEDR